MKNILISNDDGINSDGIARLARTAKKYGNVWVVAPDHQCSAMSHRITLREPIEAVEVPFPVEGVRAFATTGTPADCIRIGTLNIVEGKTDVVLSGINDGYNTGGDVQYSATVGAAMEAATNGIHAISVSEDVGKNRIVTDTYLESILDELIEKPLLFNQIWNVNFPTCELSELKGILRDRKVAGNKFYVDTYKEESLADGRKKYSVIGTYQEECDDGTDFRAVVNKYISIGIVNNLM